MSLLRLEQLSVGYQRPILSNLSLSLSAGEILGLGGSNGCGKSTLLKAISGEARIFSGTIYKAPTLNIRLQKQHPIRLANFPLSAREYLALMSAQIAHLPTRLAQLLDRRLDSLSGGQFQLLSIWACLATDSDVVLLDEPTNNLDRLGITLLLEMLNQRRPEQGIALISHDHEFVHAATTRQVDLSPFHQSDIEAL
ncbi:ATP-binding cassette domain-containing protein [Agitococcus lubricus]|uniref:ABC-type Mn2+/Zn2+ transport system ATPase subunit n=1 Tax=Agitococcus lubricus TaxID=1077255 RepID=A0A2T5J3V9_9GAMM|nr:ATP-binding cassette domain-containing protein [Agitococcus lubricus]PTQ91193.1 ABC-type Mn2+/Zn2+ transport system ATPase subunit [Agitococcus lubricus]